MSLVLIAVVVLLAVLAYFQMHNIKLVAVALKGTFQNVIYGVQPLSLDEEWKQALKSKTVLITGANRGLGKGIATDLLALGMNVVMACRSGIPEAAAEVVKDANELLRKSSPLARVDASKIQMVQLDVGSMASVDQCVAELKKRGIKLDVYITNAAVVPMQTELTKEGLETSFAINFLGHFYLLKKLLESQVLPLPKADHNLSQRELPRIVVVSSESHRMAKKLSETNLFEANKYTIASAMQNYALTKLMTATFSFEAARQINGGSNKARALVFSLCPGPVNSNIAHHAGKWLNDLVVKPMMKVFFASPLAAARYVTSLVVKDTQVSQTNTRYFHLHTEKAPREDVLDPAAGAKLWNDAEKILRTLGR